MLKGLILGLLLILPSFAQISGTKALINQSGTLAQIPSTCTPGQEYFAKDQTPGQNIYGCTVGNVWTLQGGGTGSVAGAVANVTPVTVNANTTSPQVLQQLTLPAGLLNVAGNSGGVYTYNGSGIYTAAALQTPTLTWVLNACTVSGCGSGTVRAVATIVTPAVVTATNNTWNIRLHIANTTTGSSGTLLAHGSAIVELTVSSDLGTASSDANTASTAAIDLTGNVYLQLTVTTSTGNAGNSITEDHSSLEPASSIGPTGATPALGNAVLYTASHTMVSDDLNNQIVFSATSGVSYVFLATPPVTPFATAITNCSTSQTVTLDVNTNSAVLQLSGNTVGTPANIIIPIAPGSGQCVSWSVTSFGSGVFAVSRLGTTGPAGATGATGPQGAAGFGTPGTTHTFSGTSDIFVCTSTCTLTVPVPVAGVQYCALNTNNVATVITFSAIGSSARYENTARTAYGTAGTGTFVSGGSVKDAACILGLDSTHYLTPSSTGTWVAN